MTNEELIKKHAAHKRHIEQIKAIVMIAIMIAIALGFMLLILNRPKISDEYPIADNSSDNSLNTPEENNNSNPVLSNEDKESVDESVNTTLEEFKDTTMLFTGDVLFSDYVLSNYEKNGVNGVVSKDILDEMTSADLTIVNNEFPFSLRGQKAPDKQFTFRVDPKYSVLLNEMGIDIVSLANNHVLDFGKDALSDTFETLDNAGIDYIGAGDSLKRASALITKEVNGKTFGFLAASRVIPVASWDIKNNAPGVFTTYDPALLVAAIRDAKNECDFLTVFVHWGIERDAYPQDYQVNMAKMYADAGANLVIGAHPHVLQGITYENDTPIFYSLGNFIFNQSIPMTAAVKVTVPYDGRPQIRIIPAMASNALTYMPEGENADNVYKYLESISKDISITDDGIINPAK